MIVYLVRHAERKAGDSQSDIDALPLGISKYGRLQAIAAAKKIKKFKISQLISSPIARARETATIISNHIKVPVAIDDRLVEFFTNPYEIDGKKRNDSKKKATQEPNFIFSSGESLNGASTRLENTLQEISGKSKGDVCVVTHRVIIEALLRSKFGIGRSESEWLGPASITAIEIKEGGIMGLRFVNRIYRDMPLLWETFKRKIGIKSYA